MLIFFDIDGTIIGEETHKMTESTKWAIKKARENGHLCIVNTGRSQALVRDDMFDLTLFDGYLMGCGTMVMFQNEILLHETFPVELAEDIIAGLRKNRIDAILEGKDNNFHDFEENVVHESFRQYIHYFDDFGYALFDKAPGAFDKFYCYADDYARMKAFIDEFSDRLDFVDRKKGNFEITPKGFSKATGMIFLADKLGIPMEETVAIGDSSNDISMLECAHIAIAMGNATDDIKALADFVTTDVEEDGILNALKWLGAV